MKDIVLQGFVKDFAENYSMSKKDESDVFEAFAVSTVLRKFHQSEVTDLDDFLVGGGGDGGIDAVAILVNGHPACTKEDVTFFAERLRRLDVEFVFVQAKTSASFEAASIGTFIHGVEQFFSQEPQIRFSSELQRLRCLKDYVYQRSAAMEHNPRCFLYYVAAGVWREDPEPKSILTSGSKRLQQTNIFWNVTATPVDAERLKTIYRELERGITKEVDFTKVAVFPKIDGVDEAYVGLLPGDQFLNLITTEEGTLNRELFYDNVRDFQGHNPVNREIAGTLADKDARGRFALLNNGVTVVARSIKRTGDTFKISDFQIVNGCQTSHILFQNKNLVDETTYIPVKLVVTNDSEIITEVIKATNRQTAVLPEALESLAPFHKELEDFYNVQESANGQFRVYYERRSKQYALDRIKPGNIVSLTGQTKSFVAMFLNEPHSHPRYYGELLKSYESRLFVQDHNPAAYYASGYTLLAVERVLNAGKLDREVRKYKYHLLMLIRMQIGGRDLPRLNSNALSAYSLRIVQAIRDEYTCVKEVQRAWSTIERELRTFPKDAASQHPSLLRAFTLQLLENAEQTPKRTESGPGEPCIGVTETGKIRWYDDWKNFGFIERDAGGDIFVHRSGISAVPWRLRQPGTPVVYTVTQGPTSPKADDVRVSPI